MAYAEEKLQSVPNVTLIGFAKPKIGVLSFTIKAIHPHDVSAALDHEGIMVRAGHHCAMPLMQQLGVPATVRASFGVYNCTDDIDALVDAIRKTQKIF